MAIPARRAVLAVVSAVAATLLAGGGAAASLGSDVRPAGSAGPAGLDTGAAGGTGAPADYERNGVGNSRPMIALPVARLKPWLAIRAAEVGVVVAPRGRLIIVLAFTVRDGRIAGYDVIADPARLRQLGLAVPGEEI
jgi:hypothetical protein